MVRKKVAKGTSIPASELAHMREKKGSSNAGKYKNVSKNDFAGDSGGASKYSFTINTPARAKSALARAHFAPNPEGIKSAVYRKYPKMKER